MMSSHVQEMGSLNTQVQVHVQAAWGGEHVMVFGFTSLPQWTHSTSSCSSSNYWGLMAQSVMWGRLKNSEIPWDDPRGQSEG